MLDLPPIHLRLRGGVMSFLDGLGALEGLRIPGGCPDCDAYQTVDASHAPIYRVNVHHDESGPSYLAMREQQR